MRTQRINLVVSLYNQGKIVPKYGLMPVEREMLILVTYRSK